MASVLVALAMGATLAPPAAHAVTAVRLTADGSTSSNPAISYGVDGDCRVVWTDSRDGNAEIYFALVDAWGNRLTRDVRVSISPSVSSTGPRVGVDAAGFAYLCWREGSRIWIAKLDRLGNVVVAPQLVDLGFSHVVGQDPDIAVLPDGRFGLSFGARNTAAINSTYIVNYSAALGKLCQTNPLYENITFLDPPTSIRCSGNLSCTAAWERSGFLDGSGLSTRTSNSLCQRGSVQTQCSNLNVTSMSIRGGGVAYQLSNRIYLYNGADCQATFSEVAGQGFSPASDTLDATYSIVAWEDRRNGNADIYFSKYSRATLAKSGVDSNLVSGSSLSQVPAVTSDRQGTAFFAWQDNRDGNAEIYVARSPEPSASRGTIVGTVYDAVTLLPLDSAEVHVTFPDRPPLPQAPSSKTFVAADNGQYRIAGLVPGRYAITATTPAHSSDENSGIEVAAGGTITVNLYVHTGTILRGSVTDDSNGLPIGRAQVQLVSDDGQFARSAETTPAGRYHFDVLPGTYDVSVSVPVPGVSGEYFSTANPYYLSKASNDVVVGGSPQALAFALTSNTVVLLHGILDDEESAGKVAGPIPQLEPVLRAEIEAEGFHTEGFDRAWSRSIPDQGAELADWFSSRIFKSARVVAHSMGGLAARWYLERIPGTGAASSIPLLITLGTPHHGTNLANDIDVLLDVFHAHDLAAGVTNANLGMRRPEFEGQLLQEWAFVRDLRAGSANLNKLNYDTYDSRDRAPCDPMHAPELLFPSTRYVTFAGEHPQSMSATTILLGLACKHDGAVPVNSAALYVSDPLRVANFRTKCLDGFGATDCDVSHFQPSLLGIPFHDTHYRNSDCVTTNVIRALKGDSIDCPNPLLVAAAAANDTSYQALAEIEHLSSPGVPVVDSIRVAAGSRFGAWVRWWRGGVQAVLTSPSGTPVDSAATYGNNAYAYFSDYGSRVVRLEVASAEGGTWAVTTTLTADSAQNVAIQPYESGEVTIAARASSPRVAPGATVVLAASVERAGAPLLGAQVEAKILVPSGGETTIVLLDDGGGADSIAADGVYATSFGATTDPGAYTLRVTATGGSGPVYGPRMARLGFDVAPGLDVRLAADDLRSSQFWGYPSDPIVVNATVYNLGDAAADSIWVLGTEDSLGVAFLDTVVTIPARGAITVGSAFRSPDVGLHRLRFFAMALGPHPEQDYGNNVAVRAVEVVSFGKSPTLVHVPDVRPEPARGTRLWSRAFPTPTRTGVTIEFVLPVPAKTVRLSVFDVAGRLVNRTDLGSRPGGRHQIVWERPAGHAGARQTGLFFYRLEADRDVAIGRILLIR